VSYHIYQTEGIILGKKNIGEADRIFSVLTWEFGRIDAIAQGIRRVESKLRYSMGTFSYARLGLVASRTSWRIVDAEELNNWKNIRETPEKLAAVFQIAELINRMVKGQEHDTSLWKEVKSAFLFLEQYKNAQGEGDLQIFGLLAQLKILSHLGYVAEHEKWFNLSLEEVQKMKPLIIFAINKALQESQL